MWRWFSINIGDSLHFGGIRLGTAAGDLHRGWVSVDGEVTSVREWQVRTELADDGLTQRVVHAIVSDKRNRTYHLTGDVLRVADIGKSGGTVVNEGLTRWICRTDRGDDVVRVRHRRVPPPGRRPRETCRSSGLTGQWIGCADERGHHRRGPATRRGSRRPGGRGAPPLGRGVVGHQRFRPRDDLGGCELSSCSKGGGPCRRPDRPRAPTSGWRPACSGWPRYRVPVPAVVGAGAEDGLPPGWLVVERLEGETIPRDVFSATMTTRWRLGPD